MKKLLFALLAFAGVAFAAEVHDALRGPAALEQTTNPPPLVNPDNSDVGRTRNFAMQPPVVPHKVEGYQLDKNANRCMMCHARTRTQESQAPMISVTHFMDRDGNFPGRTVAAPVLLHAMPRAAGQRELSGRKPLHRRRYDAQQTGGTCCFRTGSQEVIRTK